MEIKITDRKENPLLKRKEIVFEAEHKGGATPSKKEVRSRLAALLTADEKLLIVDEYASSVGSGTSCGRARLYSDAKMLAKAENRPIVKKNIENRTKKEKKQAAGGSTEAPAPAAKPAKSEEKKK